MPSSRHGSTFKFRSRHEPIDWRRIGAIDVDRVANELDFVTLQENIMSITFCNMENERCPHCKNSLDPILIKLFRLAQFTIEYLLHSQEYLTSNLQNLEEKVQATVSEADLLQCKMVKQSEEVKSLKEECKRRKKIIATQQMMISAGAGSYHKCHQCDKAFMNNSFLQNHIQRRHPEAASHEKSKLQTSEKLQQEISQLKEELKLTKCQLLTEQSAQMEKLSKFQEMEHRKTIEQEILGKFNIWKEEEKEKLSDEMRNVKDMFMKEFTELTVKNSSLEKELQELKKDNLQMKSGLGTLQGSRQKEEENSKCSHSLQNVKELLQIQEDKWGNRIQQLHQEHDKEKNQLLVQIEKLKLSMSEDQRTSNDFYKKRIDELGQRIQEQNELIRTQKEQIKEISVKPPAAAKKYPVPAPTPAQHIIEPKPNVPLTRDLDGEDLPRTSKQQLINALKKNPALTRELRTVLEQGLAEKLESLGVKPGVRGIPSEHLNRIMDSMEYYRGVKETQIPEIHHIRENLARRVNFKAEERALSSSPELGSAPQLFTEVKSSGLSSKPAASLPKQSKAKSSSFKSSQEEPLPEQSNSVPRKKTTAKIKLVSSKEACVTKPSSIKTPPFTSDDESDIDDVPLHCYKPTESFKPKPLFSKQGNIGFVTSESDSEGSLLEEIDPQPAHKHSTPKPGPSKPARATMVKELSGLVEKHISSHSSNHKTAGSTDVARTFLNKDAVTEFKVADIDDSEFDSSSMEEENFEVPRLMKSRQDAVISKRNSSAPPVKNAFGASKISKGDGREADTSSTLVSSLVTVSDFSDSSDV
ncbi:cilium assembly protein DZIP1 [Rhinophrynus dorsalis]